METAEQRAETLLRATSNEMFTTWINIWKELVSTKSEDLNCENQDDPKEIIMTVKNGHHIIVEK